VTVTPPLSFAVLSVTAQVAKLSDIVKSNEVSVSEAGRNGVRVEYVKFL
jgi:hypothetical protein